MTLKSGLARVGKPWHSKQRVLSERKSVRPRRSRGSRAVVSPIRYRSKGEASETSVRSKAAIAPVVFAKVTALPASPSLPP
jgi:hypothetical protein